MAAALGGNAAAIQQSIQDLMDQKPGPNQWIGTAPVLAFWAMCRSPGRDGIHTARGQILAKPHPEMGYRCCLGLVRLGGRHTTERLEAAAARALHFGAYSFASVESTRRHHLEKEPLPGVAEPQPAVAIHPNIRGAAYFDSIQ